MAIWQSPQEILLDLNNVDLYGWERQKSSWVVEAIINGIGAGDEFPPVAIIKINDSTYRLSVSYQTLDLDLKESHWMVDIIGLLGIILKINH